MLYSDLSGPDEDDVILIESIDSSNTLWRCSATLVAPNLFVTAKHCVSNYIELTFTCGSDGSLIAGPGGYMGVLDTPSKISVKVGTSPGSKVSAKGARIFAADTDTICRNDFALVLLDRDLPGLPIAPIRLYSGVTKREPLRIVGYGLASAGPDAGVGVRHTRDGVLISQVGASEFRTQYDKIPPRTFTVDGPVGCMGDSGGPAFADSGALVGVFSQFVGECSSPNTVNYFTEVGPFRDQVILPAFNAAGYEPWLEGNSEPGLYGTGGAAGTGGQPSSGGEPATGGVASAAAGGTGPLGESGGMTFVRTGAGGVATGGTVSPSGGASATTAPIGGAAPAIGGAPVATGGNTLGGVVYDRGPSKGGSCGCRVGLGRGYEFGVLALLASVLGVRRRRVKPGR